MELARRTEDDLGRILIYVDDDAGAAGGARYVEDPLVLQGALNADLGTCPQSPRAGAWTRASIIYKRRETTYGGGRAEDCPSPPITSGSS